MPLPIFPVHLFNPKVVKVAPAARVIDGGTSLSGIQDVISADGGGRWYGSYGEITLNSPQLERYWAQWISYFGGGATAFYAPVLSLRTAPRPSLGKGPISPSSLYSNDTVFPIEVRRATPYISAVTVGSAAVGDVAITINILQGARLEGGETFSVAGRAYVIQRISAVSGQQAQCVLNMPLRAAVANNVAVNFEWPIVQAKILIGQDLAPEMSFNYGSVSLQWAEDFSDAV